MIYLPSNRSPRPHTQRFAILQPFATHYGPVSCRDYECEQFLGGFALVLPQGDDLARMRHWLKSGFPDGIKRMARETPREGGLTELRFEPGTPCLKATQHRWHVRPPLFAHERNETRRHLKFDEFTDLMNEESYKLAHEREKG